MSKISFISQKLFFSASVSLVSQCQPRQSVSASSVKRVFCQPFPVLQMHSIDISSLLRLLMKNLTMIYSVMKNDTSSWFEMKSWVRTSKWKKRKKHWTKRTRIERTRTKRTKTTKRKRTKRRRRKNDSKNFEKIATRLKFSF